MILLLLAWLLSACQAPAPTSPADLIETSVSEYLTAAPTATLPSQTPSATPTRTLTPSATPSPTPTPTRTPRPTFPPAEALQRGPYLQSAQADSIWVVWDTARATRGYVEFGPAEGQLDQVVVEANPAQHHEVQLGGLKPYTLYQYRVGGSDLVSSFRSAPGPDQTAFRFAVIGDTRSVPEMHAAVIAQMAKSRPDMALHLGDLVEDGKNSEQWDQFFKIEAPLLRSAPLYPTLGNHEAQDPQYFHIFHLPGNERWYAFDYGPARFIILQVDSYDPAPFKPGGEQRAWLEEQLAGSRAEWLFVSFHIPIHTSWGEDPSEINLRAQLEPLFEKYRVSAVFAGHFHQYERIQTGGIAYIIGGGCGAPQFSFSTPEPGSMVRLETYEFLQVDISGKQAVCTAIGIDGRVIDQFTLP